MTYAIIKVAGKQYRVREGERLLVDRLAQDEGATFTPAVLLVGGDGAPVLEPDDVKVTAKVLGAVKGPKIRIGKYKKRTGYRRHGLPRLTDADPDRVHRGQDRSSCRAVEESGREGAEARHGGIFLSDLPAGYPDMTIADIKAAAGGWDAGALEALRSRSNATTPIERARSPLSSRSG